MTDVCNTPTYVISVSYGKTVSQHTLNIIFHSPHTYMQLYYRTDLPFHSTFVPKTPRKTFCKITLFYNFLYPYSLELCIHYDIPQHPTSPHPILPFSNLSKCNVILILFYVTFLLSCLVCVSWSVVWYLGSNTCCSQKKKRKKKALPFPSLTSPFMFLCTFIPDT